MPCPLPHATARESRGLPGPPGFLLHPLLRQVLIADSSPWAGLLSHLLGTSKHDSTKTKSIVGIRFMPEVLSAD